MQNEIMNKTPNLTINTYSIEDLILKQKEDRLSCNGIITSIATQVIYCTVNDIIECYVKHR